MSDLMTEEEIFEEENKRREEDELYRFQQSLCDAVDVVARNDIAPPKEVAFMGIWFFSQMMYAMAPSKEAADEAIKIGVEYGYQLDKNQILSSENEALRAENKRLNRELKTKGKNELVTCPECEFDMETGFIDDCGVCFDCLEKEEEL